MRMSTAPLKRLQRPPNYRRSSEILEHSSVRMRAPLRRPRGRETRDDSPKPSERWRRSWCGATRNASVNRTYRGQPISVGPWPWALVPKQCSAHACLRQRGDRIEMWFAAVHGSPHGTFGTCRRPTRMSVHWGRPEVVGLRSERRE
jgi:hypothetical protein